LKLLNSEESIEELSQEQARHFYGLLNQKVHWRVKDGSLRKLFKVEKVDRVEGRDKPLLFSLKIR